MNWQFGEKDWERIRKRYEQWWKEGRPTLHLSFYGEESPLPKPEGLITENLFHVSPQESAERLAEKYEYMHSLRRYELEGYPHTWIYFGPVYSVEFIGCRANPQETTNWFTARHPCPPEQRHITLDPESEYLPREIALRRALEERFGDRGYVVSGGRGSGCPLDEVIEFYDHEEIFYLMYDDPDTLFRLMDEVVEAENEVKKRLGGLTPRAKGYTGWGGIFAPEPWTGAQCDACAMMGPKEFEKFQAPYLERIFRDSPEYNYYHLDGPGEIVHLDRLLAMEDLKCIQWVAAPNGELSLTLDVYERIHRGGKRMWVTGSLEDAREVAWRNGTAEGIYWYGSYPIEEYDRVMKLAEELQSGFTAAE